MELSELHNLNRTELARAKAFLTQQVERYRRPYERRVVEVPRQCVFIGTTNHETWLRDETGNRRFWPVRCTKIDLDGLRRDRDQLWAEALLRVRQGATWWLEDPDVIKDAQDEQQKRYQSDAWQETIEGWLKNPQQAFDSGHPVADFSSTRTWTTIDDILHHCLRKPLSQWSQLDKNRIAACLTALKWERHRQSGKRGEKRPWGYAPAVSQ